MSNKVSNKKVAITPKAIRIEVYQDKYMSIYRLDELGTFEIKYSVNAFDLFDFNDAVKVIDQVMIEIKKQLDAGFTYSIILLNTLDGGPTIEHQAQNYVHTQLFPFYLKNNICTKVYCLSEEIISKLSMTVTAEKDPSKKFTNVFFSNYKDCIEWISKRDCWCQQL